MLSLIAVLAIGISCWLVFRTTVKFTGRSLPWRVTREEVERKVPMGTPYQKVIESFGMPTREIRFGLTQRGLTYISDTNLTTPHTHLAFTVHITNGHVAAYAFSSDQFSDQ